ncbi:peptide chain release factor 1 [Phragmitibacter flavus]|uniref:Peptide chain release factor 1 n=1 Tax=Phragmitibacter flavus TaxID=2576071 RepID=A0A5R8KB50_9BACT|nr:peptide chain release factor 1 [Phragmitibacter flavus]TLD69544.1 peptide chain release factor 1 [Phragmitibacter flavus]
MDYSSIIEKKKLRLSELEMQMEQPDFYEDNRKASGLLREHRHLQALDNSWEEFLRVGQQIVDNEDLAKSGDAELAEMAEEELPSLRKRLEELEGLVQLAILPPDPLEGRDVIMEIRAGTGGDEAALFAGDLMRMYGRYAEERGWKVEPLEASPADLGGFREVVFKVSGEDVFSTLKYESGVHRVQRVPATEAQGRIHTSTATVAVLPEAEEVDIEFKPDEVRIEVCRASGNGGQGVNTTDSAVQVMHMPTGTIVRCQDGRSQLKNKEKALSILRSRLLERKQNEEAAKYSAHRRSLIGSGGREEKIRTYNYPQNRITDHRIEVTLYNLEMFVEGRIQEMVEKLKASDVHDRLAEAGLR